MGKPCDLDFKNNSKRLSSMLPGAGTSAWTPEKQARRRLSIEPMLCQLILKIGNPVGCPGETMSARICLPIFRSWQCVQARFMAPLRVVNNWAPAFNSVCHCCAWFGGALNLNGRPWLLLWSNALSAKTSGFSKPLSGRLVLSENETIWSSKLASFFYYFVQ